MGLALVSGDMFFETICSCVMNCEAVISTIIVSAMSITERLNGWPAVMWFHSPMKVDFRGAPKNSAFAKEFASCCVNRPTPALSCCASFSTENRPKKIGICSRRGRHDERGLVPVRL